MLLRARPCKTLERLEVGWKISTGVASSCRYYTSSPFLRSGLDASPQSPNQAKVEILSVGKTLPGEAPNVGNFHSLVNDGLTLRWGTRTSRFDSIWLRDSCSCEQCVDPHSGQRSFQTAHIPENISIANATVVKGDSVLINWRNDMKGCSKDHQTIFPAQFLEEHSANGAKKFRLKPKPWGTRNISIFQYLKSIPYEAFVNDEQTMGNAMLQLQDYGLVLIDGVPELETSVERIGERIGPLRDTFYGRTWDVKDKPNAENVAYTSKHLGLHMDLLYMKDPPGIQLLHCLKSSCEGGNSIFTDSFEAARKLKSLSLKAYEDLARIQVRYKYDKGDHFYTDTKTTFELGPPDPTLPSHRNDPTIEYVNWSPPFQGLFEIGYGSQDRGDEIRNYLTAAKAFASLVDDPLTQTEHRLEPGQCVIFNNRRILHGRKEFQSGKGERWLKGAYVNTEDFKSTVHKHVQKRAVSQLKE